MDAQQINLWFCKSPSLSGKIITQSLPSIDQTLGNSKLEFKTFLDDGPNNCHLPKDQYILKAILHNASSQF